VIPAALRQREVAACAHLARTRPELAEVAQRATEAKGSPISWLVRAKHLDEAGYAALLADQGAWAQPTTWAGIEVGPELGRGVHGVVLRSRHEGEPAALKIYLGQADDRLAERFRREVVLLAKLEHPGIVRLLRAGEAERFLFHQTELVEGGSLADALRRHGPLAPQQALPLIAAAADALGYAHARGVVHRDVKPANLLLGAGGAPRWVDFGLARDPEAERLTASSAFLGTAPYAAPEQMHSAATVDGRADVFGLGAVLHVALTGRPPFAAQTLTELFGLLQRGPTPISLPHAPGFDPAPLDALLRRMLAFDAAGRPETLEEVASALRGLTP
jgi:serine/threonine-protein kinase